MQTFVDVLDGDAMELLAGHCKVDKHAIVQHLSHNMTQKLMVEKEGGWKARRGLVFNDKKLLLFLYMSPKRVLDLMNNKCGERVLPSPSFSLPLSRLDWIGLKPSRDREEEAEA